MTQHTPGPWKIHDDNENTLDVIAPWSTTVRPESASGYGDWRGITVSTIRHQDDNPCVSKDQASANAALIAAAPELLEALKALRNWCDEEINGAPPEYRRIMGRADAAIRKSGAQS